MTVDRLASLAGLLLCAAAASGQKPPPPPPPVVSPQLDAERRATFRLRVGLEDRKSVV